MAEKKDSRTGHSGRKNYQRLKAYLILQYLLRNTDNEHVATVPEIIAYLQDDCGIDAERRALYKDIKEINIVSLMLQDDCTFEDAESELEENPGRVLICYKKRKKNGGFYVCDENRSMTFEDARLLAECVYAARFVSKDEEKRLIRLVTSSLSEVQQKEVEHDVLALDSHSTINRDTISNIDEIKKAMQTKEGHKIRFKYLKYALQNPPVLTERRRGDTYTVSPYAMLIDNGNYYLLAIDERFKDQKLRTFRIDRMRKLKILRDTRTETEEVKNLDLHDYTRRVFSMYGGRRERVTLRFVNSLLDTVVDRFGTEDVIYSQMDTKHFTATVSVEVSNQFYGWICGFGNKVKIVSPDWVREDFSAYVQKITELYQSR